MDKQITKAVEEAVDQIKSNDLLLDKNGKLSMDDLKKVLMFVSKQDVREEITCILKNDGTIKQSKGSQTYSPVQRWFYDLITEGKLQEELSKVGEMKVVLPSDLKDTINKNENGDYTFFNLLKQEIKLNCNFDNLEVKKAKKKLEKQNAELTKNMNKKS